MSRSRSRKDSSDYEDLTSSLSEMIDAEFREELPDFTRRMFSIDRSRFYDEMSTLKNHLYDALKGQPDNSLLRVYLKKLEKDCPKGKDKEEYVKSELNKIIKTALSNIPDFQLEPDSKLKLDARAVAEITQTAIQYAILWEAGKRCGFNREDKRVFEVELGEVLQDIYQEKNVSRVVEKSIEKGIEERETKRGAFHQTVDRVLLVSEQARADIGSFNKDIRDLRKLYRHGHLHHKNDERRMQRIADRCIQRAMRARAKVPQLNDELGKIKTRLEEAGHMVISDDRIAAAFDINRLIPGKLSQKDFKDMVDSIPAIGDEADCVKKLKDAFAILGNDKMKNGTELRDLRDTDLNKIADAIQVMHPIMIRLRGKDERDNVIKEMQDVVIQMKSYMNHYQENQGFKPALTDAAKLAARDRVDELQTRMAFYEERVKLNMQNASAVDMRLMGLRLPQNEEYNAEETQQAVRKLEASQRKLRGELGLVSQEEIHFEDLDRKLRDRKDSRRVVFTEADFLRSSGGSSSLDEKSIGNERKSEEDVSKGSALGAGLPPFSPDHRHTSVHGGLRGSGSFADVDSSLSSNKSSSKASRVVRANDAEFTLPPVAPRAVVEAAMRKSAKNDQVGHMGEEPKPKERRKKHKVKKHKAPQQSGEKRNHRSGLRGLLSSGAGLFSRRHTAVDDKKRIEVLEKSLQVDRTRAENILRNARSPSKPEGVDYTIKGDKKAGKYSYTHEEVVKAAQKALKEPRMTIGDDYARYRKK